MPLNKDLRELLGLLHSNGVEYLVVGTFAVALQGFPRYTAALDLLVRPTAENADRVLRALGIRLRHSRNPDLLTYPPREMSGFRWREMERPGERVWAAVQERLARSAAADGR